VETGFFAIETSQVPADLKMFCTRTYPFAIKSLGPLATRAATR
jgi:hypothetical protein